MEDKQYLVKLVGKNPETGLPYQVGEHWIRAYSLEDARILANRHRTLQTTHVFIFALERQYEVERRSSRSKPGKPKLPERETLSYAERLKKRPIRARTS